MCETMETLGTVRKMLALLGFRSTDNTKKQLILRYILPILCLVLLCYGSFTPFYYLIFEAENFSEQSQAFLAFYMLFFPVCLQVILIFEYNKFNDMLDQLQYHVQQSEFLYCQIFCTELAMPLLNCQYSIFEFQQKILEIVIFSIFLEFYPSFWKFSVKTQALGRRERTTF